MTQSKPSNGRRPTLEPPQAQHLQKMLLPLSRKISWAIGSTYTDATGERLPRKMVDNTADGLAMQFLTDLAAYFEALA